MSNLVKHILQQAIFPDQDCHQWMAFLVLREKYKDLTYLSYDGYSCDGLADYSKNLLWQDNRILDWTDKSVILQTDKKFWEYSTNEICNIWMKVNGETTKTKREWLGSIQ